MNAVEFVKKYGWTAVIAAVKSTTAEETAAFESKDLDPILAKDGTAIGFNVKVHAIPYLEVKSLVESWELVEKHGGLISSKKFLKFLQSSVDMGLYHGLDDIDYTVVIPKMEKAIRDVESVGGGV